MLDTLQAIDTRYSCRSFRDEALASDVLDRIALSGVASPSGMNRQAWRVVLVKNRRLIEEMDEESMRVLSEMDDKSMYDRMMERGGKMLYNAPAMIVIPIEPGSELDCGIVTENIALTATALGVDNVICGMARIAFMQSPRAEEFRKRLGFPEGYVFGMSVLLGYATAPGKPHTPDMAKITVVE